MSLLDQLAKNIRGVQAQINPFDHGQTYQSVMHPQAPQAQPNPNIPVGQINGRPYNYGGDFLPTPQEDSGMVPGPQGPNPMNADIGHMRQTQAMRPMFNLNGMANGMPVQSVDGYYPQDQLAPMADPTDMLNYIQGAYNGPQTSVYGGQNPLLQVYGGAQQPAGNPMSQNTAADPLGWSQNGQTGVIRRYPLR